MTGPQGTASVKTDASDALVGREARTPYGLPIQLADGAGGPGYTGHVYDGAIGLSYMQQRHHDPLTARFLSPDPVGSRDGLNVYAYVHNDLVNATDPTGEFANFAIGFALGFGMDAAVQFATTGEVNVRQAAISGVAGMTGVGAAQKIRQVMRNQGAIRTAVANAAAGINAGAGVVDNATDGDPTTQLGDGLATNAALGAAGTELGSVLEGGALLALKSGTVLGEEGVMTSGGRAVAQGLGDGLANLTTQSSNVGSDSVSTERRPLEVNIDPCRSDCE